MADTSSATFKRPYADSSMFFAHVKKETQIGAGGLQRWEITQRVFERAEAGDYPIITSAATLAEVRRLQPKTEQLRPDELEQVRRFFEHQWIQLVDVTREIGELAQDLGARYGIAVIDSIHLASAIRWQCDMLLLWDKPFVNAITDNPIQGVTVCEPFWQGQVSF